MPPHAGEQQTEDRINAILSEAQAAMHAKQNTEKVRLFLNVTTILHLWLPACCLGIMLIGSRQKSQGESDKNFTSW